MLRRTVLTSRILACVSYNAAHLLFRYLGAIGGCRGQHAWILLWPGMAASSSPLLQTASKPLMSCGRSRVIATQTLPQESFTIGESFWHWFSES